MPASEVIELPPLHKCINDLFYLTVARRIEHDTILVFAGWKPIVSNQINIIDIPCCLNTQVSNDAGKIKRTKNSKFKEGTVPFRETVDIQNN